MTTEDSMRVIQAEIDRIQKLLDEKFDGNLFSRQCGLSFALGVLQAQKKFEEGK